MSENREVILADFQACTGIEDVGEAIMHLERNNWDLLGALSKVMNFDSQQLPSEVNSDVEMVEVVQGVPVVTFTTSATSTTIVTTTITATTSATTATKSQLSEDIKNELLSKIRFNNDNDKPSTSNSTSTRKIPKKLSFNVSYLNKSYTINISESCNISDLKALIYKKTKVTPCQQKLDGWRDDAVNDFVTLQSLNLPPENKLILGKRDPSEDIMCNRLTNPFTLNIYDSVNKKTYNLKFPGTHTILEVKTGIYSLTNIPVRNQQWEGWPKSLKDDNVTLAESKIRFPEHDLTLSKAPIKEKKDKELINVESESSADEADDLEEFEDAPESFIIEDDIFIDNIQPAKVQRLMPEHVEDETMGTIYFSEQFEKRYGPIHPEFFTGTFDEAIKESCLKPPKERKLLAVYLHHDSSVLTNVFCTQLLGCEAVLQILSVNFIVYGWDLTYEQNKQMILESVSQSLGIVGSEAIRNINVDALPVLMIFMRSRSTTEIFTIVHGNLGVNELLTSLIQAVDVFQEQRRADIDVEEERQARERVKQEQDRAYQESLAVDRAKEEAKQIQIQIEKEKQEQAENQRLADQARKEAHRLAVESSLPPEPDSEVGVMKIKIRLPGGNYLERKFKPDTPLQTLFNFIIVEGYPTEDYKVLLTWPRKDLTSMDNTLTFSQLKFCPQETVILEER